MRSYNRPMLRRLVTVMSGLGLTLVLPAAAAVQDETVTLLPNGEAKQLTTVFDKSIKYTLVASGVITFDYGNGSTFTIDPFHSFTGDCQDAFTGVYLQVKDASGNLLDVHNTGSPSCRSDHRYVFVVNKKYPATWDFHGKATAYATYHTTPGVTAKGSFTLQIKRGDKTVIKGVVFKVLATKELVGTKRDDLLGDVRLGGAGRLVNVDSRTGYAASARGVLSLSLNWLHTADQHLALRPIGQWRYLEAKRAVTGHVQVVSSNVRTCRRGAKLYVALRHLRTADVLTRPDCDLEPRYNEHYYWRDPGSDLAVRITEVE
jgi:hypothetical protein